MSEQQKMPSLIPMWSVSDANATVEWFEKLGFTLGEAMRMPDGSIGHAEVARGWDVRIMFGPSPNPTGSPGQTLYIALDEDIDRYYESVTRAGITADEAPQDQFWGHRTFTVTHPDGYPIMFAQHVKDVSVQEAEAAMAQMVPA